MQERTGQTAVIFRSHRTDDDDAGYAAAASAMEQLAARQPGYCGIDAARGNDRIGITVSYWEDADAAAAWRDHPDHVAIRALGRARWYDAYEIAVTTVDRAYRWSRG